MIISTRHVIGSRFFNIAANGRRLGEGCLADAQFSHKTFWQLLPNRCYVLGGLFSTEFNLKRNDNNNFSSFIDCSLVLRSNVCNSNYRLGNG